MSNILSQINCFLENKDNYTTEEQKRIEDGFLNYCNKRLKELDNKKNGLEGLGL